MSLSRVANPIFGGRPVKGQLENSVRAKGQAEDVHRREGCHWVDVLDGSLILGLDNNKGRSLSSACTMLFVTRLDLYNID